MQKPWKSNTKGRCACRYATISANDAEGTESGEHREGSLRCSTPTRSSKIPMTVHKLMLTEQKEHPDIMCIATDPVLNEKTRERVSGSAAEETVPDVREARE